MGCGKSKHDAVATGNTISHSKTSNSETPTTTTTTTAPNFNLDREIDHNPSSSSSSSSSSPVHQHLVEECPGNIGNLVVVEEIENPPQENDGQIVSETEVKEEEDEKAEGNEGVDHLFSDGKGKRVVSIESIISDGLSGVSDYYSPRAAKDAGEDEDEEEKVSVEETIEKAVEVEEENIEKRAEVEAKAEGEATANAEPILEEQKTEISHS